MNKRERLEKTVVGAPTDRPPVALWRHWQGDDQRPADLALSIVEFQKRWDFDFIKVTPASSYCLVDYGVQDRWEGHPEGTRAFTQRVIHTPEDWSKLPRLDPTKGGLGGAMAALRLVWEGVGDGAPILHTIFSPLAQAKNLVGSANLLGCMHEAPQALKAGLEIITDNMVRYLEALKSHTHIDGIFYAIQHASYALMTEADYLEFGAAYDRRILAALAPDWWFNMLHLHGDSPMFDLVADYPIQAINWHDRETSPSLAVGKTKFGGALCGGLGRWDAVHNGTPEEVQAQALDAFEQTEGRRLILSTGCVLMTTSPISNIRAARQAVEAFQTR